MRRLIIGAAVVVSFAGGALAQAAGGWRTFAASSNSNDYGTYASADATVQAPKALAVRVSGKSEKPFQVSWHASCEGVAQLRSGQVVSVAVARAAQCTVYGSAQGGTGTLKVELLRR